MAFLKRTLFCLCLSNILTYVITEKVYTDEFAAHIRGGRSVADQLAAKYGYINKGQIGELEDHYLFHHKRVQRRSVLPSEGEHTFLENEPMVEWLEQQHIKKRVKRDFLEVERRDTEHRIANLQQGLMSRESKKLDKLIKDPKKLNDPDFKDQWYMDRSGLPTMNVEGAWELGYTGLGVVVSILDDGIEATHADLVLNFDQQASYDYNNNRKNPSPRYDFANTNRHGTRCAGEVAMQADNGICGVGIAYNASIGGVRMLDGDVTDSVEGKSLSHARRHIDIYSASWGPDDDGSTVDGPGRLAKQAFKEGIAQGRHGLGSIYVWASGNGGHQGDSCSCDGYTNSIYTLSISSTSENGASPWYLETCASTLATTYSSGDRKERKVVTTDIHQSCTKEHTGTSASAPIAAGIIALALQANPALTWRDVQYLVVRTSRKENLKAKDWTVNGAGYEVSHYYGFGLMDAKALVEASKTWTTLPEQRVCEINVIDSSRGLDGSTTRIAINTTACEGTDNHVGYLEHVQAVITLSYSQRGALKMRLISPHETESTILQPRRGDRRFGEFSEWPFMSTHYWGEEASGQWILEVENTGLESNSGRINQWTLILYGTDKAPNVGGSTKLRSNQRNRRDGDVDDSWDTSDWGWDSSSYYYSDENCHEECWEDKGCDGPNANDCYKCKHFRDRKSQDCVKNCPDGQYPPTYMHERCKYCSKECATCVGQEFWDCTSCTGNLVLQDGECLNECDDGFYSTKGDNICRRCDDLCFECKGAPDNCQSCVAGAVLDGNECTLSCPTNYYLRDGQCQPCHALCEDCHGPEATDCISCNVDLIHKGNKCVEEADCPTKAGFYINSGIHGGVPSRECIPCHPTCATCTGFSFDDCTSCKDSDTYLNYGVCEPDCQDGTYRSVDDGVCHECPDGCRLCIGESICIACEDDKVLAKGGCQEGCSTGLYDSEGECYPCHNLCKECNDGGLTDCTECKQTDGERYLLEGACLPFCPEGYYMDDDSHTCMECDETCRRCNSEQCIECIDENVTPDPGAWDCGEDEHGQTCGDGCQTCIRDEPDNCFECKDGYYLFNFECKRVCPMGYFGDVNKKSCRLCHPTCRECSGLHLHECTACDKEYVLAPVGHIQNNKKTCETHCPDGYYEENSIESGDHRICLPCDETCSTCDGALDADCITCSIGIYLQVDWSTVNGMPTRKCVEECEDGTFGAPDDGECLPCHPSCKTCFNSPTQCTECNEDEGYVRDANDINSCVNEKGCRDDQFVDTRTNECENCDYTCETCNGPLNTDCTSCDYYRFLVKDEVERRCEEVCPSGTFPDFDLNLCLKCHESCEGCVMGGPSDCLDCKPGLYSYPYDGQACVASCPEGFYELEESDYKTCQQCSVECKDCHESYWQCISCNDNTYLFQDRCVNACPYQYTEDDLSNHCVPDEDARFPCPLNCLECDDWGDCKICEDDYDPYYGECIERTRKPCSDDEYPYFDGNDEIACADCHSSCATCQGDGADECLSCPRQYKLNQGTCVANCPDGMYMYESTGKCMACHPTCKTCDGPSPSECLTCEEEMMLDDHGEHDGYAEHDAHGSCHVSCPSHTFFDGSGCVHCHESCGTCDSRSENDCLTCDDGLYLYVEEETNNKKCMTSCSDGFFQYRPSDDSVDNYECQRCDASCKTCFGGHNDECTSCPSDMYKQGFTCVTNCDEGLYPDDKNLCQQCHKRCETCSGGGQDHCLSCKGERLWQEGKCVNDCQQGFYLEANKRRCGECHQRCLDCTDAGIFDCTSCRDSYVPGNGTCYNRCEKGKYWNNGTCEKCDSTCLECFGPKQDHCITCDPNWGHLKRLDVNHSSCVRCCEDNEKDSDMCCTCDDNGEKCLRTGEGKGGKGGKGKKNPTRNDAPSGNPHMRTGTVVLGVILCIAFFFTMFCILQARSKKIWCFKGNYDKLPAYYDSKGNHVIMSKQYQHEKINIMSDDEDFYEDIDSEEEED